MRSFIYAFFFLWFLAGPFSQTSALGNSDLEFRRRCFTVHLEILVSPLIKMGMVRRLQIQWENAPQKAGDWIGIFNSDPLMPINIYSGIQPLEVMSVPSVNGWSNTYIQENHVEPEHLGFTGKCLKYYAAYFTRFNETLGVTCLRTEPNWMWNLRAELGPRRLSGVFIPGTHDSAAYGEFDENSGETRVKKYSITQDESILGQLIYGTRYLDLRIGYYPTNNEKWWANHGVVRIHPLRIVLRDVRKFIENTKEIVILDFHRFPVGMKNLKNHVLLVQFLEKELGDLAVPSGLHWESTFDQVWNSGKRLIIGYDNGDVVSGSSFLWHSVRHKWGNVQTLVNLHNYLSGTLERPPPSMWSAMAELTPTPVDVLFDRMKGLRAMAELINHNVTQWFRRKTWQARSNIVSVDFIRSTGIIRSAIEWNKRLSPCEN